MGEVLAARPYSIIFCLLFFAFSSAGHAQGKKKLVPSSTPSKSKQVQAKAEPKSAQEMAGDFLRTVKSQESPLRGFSPAPAAKPADVTIYFFWASWCEYCEEGYGALVQMQNQLAGQSIAFKAINLDQTFSDAVTEKAKKMQKLGQYAAPAGVIKAYPTFQRLPIFIAEDTKTGRLVANTGFSTERFYYFTKNVKRMLNNGVSDEE